MLYKFSPKCLSQRGLIEAVEKPTGSYGVGTNSFDVAERGLCQASDFFLLFWIWERQFNAGKVSLRNLPDASSRLSRAFDLNTDLRRIPDRSEPLWPCTAFGEPNTKSRVWEDGWFLYLMDK